jgi:hypothetical protein
MKFPWLLGMVFTAFCLILIVCYGIAKQSNPVFLDQQGHPINQTSR